MPDVDSTLRTIAHWKYIIKSDLASAFYQIPLAKDSMKYYGVTTPYRGVRVNTRCSMGMPGSETALEELMCRIMGDFLQKVCVAELADDLFCGVTDGSVTKRGIGATLYINRDGKVSLAAFVSAKLRKYHVLWLPCEIEALSIAASVKHFSPIIIQSKHQANVLTDSKPCVQGFEKLCRGEISASPRVTSFLSVVSRYQVSVNHLSGSANIQSDFASRNSPLCTEPNCQYACFIKDEKQGSLRDGLIRLLIPLKPLNGPSVVVRVDPAPGFRLLSDDSYLKQLNISIEIGRVKNQNKNSVADKAIAELEDELLREERDQSPLSENTLLIDTTRLNSRLRQRGLSSRELWTQKNQFTHEQLPISDMNLIRAQHEARNKNHGFTEISKCSRPGRPIPDVSIGDLVYLYTDRSKTQARDRSKKFQAINSALRPKK
ncbi:unnamed protein product [Mytilus coruscus]|uniref:Reverse transcriptase RNase H-like domain-containing protein n=1 Tax=Mytilus coruscus TaxID=42192 RepID=A0A6J8BEK0_MYTCO|nr:unnamed protein product [Mytilus coruscus]